MATRFNTARLDVDGSTIRLDQGGNHTDITSNSPSGDITVTLPSSSATLAGLGLSNTWTGSNIFSAEVTASLGVNLAAGQAYEIDGTDVLTSTSLGSGVTGSSLTSVGALGSGSISSGFGNINNGSSSITGGAISGTTGQFSSTLSATGDVTVNTDRFKITASTGSVLSYGNYAAEGDIDLYSSYPVTRMVSLNGTTGGGLLEGLLSANGGIAVDTDKFTVAGDGTGNTAIAGTLGVAGDVSVNTNKFTVAAGTGNTLVAGTLNVTSDVAVNTNKFTVAASTGNTLAAGTLDVAGDVAVNTDKLVVTAASGNVTSKGDLTIGSGSATSTFTMISDAILTNVGGTVTLSNIGSIDATTESTIESAIDTLSNLTSIQGHTLTLTGNLIRSGAHALTITTTNTTDITLPAGSVTLTETGDKLSVFAATTSAELAGVITDETGSGGGGVLVFSNTPTLVTPNIGNATGDSVNMSGSVQGYDLISISTDPYVEVQNSSSEDDEHGREGILKFRGTGTGGVGLHTHSIIRSDHDGSGNDEKGKLRFYTNDGSDSNTPTLRLTIDSAGLATFAGAVTVGGVFTLGGQTLTMADSASTIGGNSTDHDIIDRTSTQTMSAKTLTSPNINGANLNFGAATSTNQLILPTKADQSGLSATAGNLMYDTAAKKLNIYDATDSAWAVVGGGLIPVELDHTDDTGTLVAGNHYLVDMSGASADITLNLEAGAAESVVGVTVVGASGYYVTVACDGAEAIWYSEASDTTMVVGQNASTAIFMWETGGTLDWIATVYDLYTPGTYGGDFSVTGDLSVDNITEYTTGNGVVINEAGADVDFRVEAVGVANALVVQGSDGKVGIGAAPSGSYTFETTGNGYFSSALTCNSTVTGHFAAGSAAGGIFSNASSTATVESLQVKRTSGSILESTASARWVEFFATGDSSAGYIANDGSGNLTLTTVSDIRLKENIRDAEYGLSELLQLRPVTFDWKSGTCDNVKGFIAQEVELVLPEAVSTSEGNGYEDYRTLSTSSMIPVMVKAIQEQQEIIESLSARIEQLENREV